MNEVPETPAFKARITQSFFEIIQSLIFLFVWISPLTIHEHMVNALIAVIYLELYFLLATAFIDVAHFKERVSKHTKIKFVLGSSIIPLFLIIKTALAFQTLWAIAALIWEIFNKVINIIIGKELTKPERRLVEERWVFAFLALPASFAICIFLPIVAGSSLAGNYIPMFGVIHDPSVYGLPSVFLGETHNHIAMGFMYFTAVAIFKLTALDYKWARSNG